MNRDRAAPQLTLKGNVVRMCAVYISTLQNSAFYTHGSNMFLYISRGEQRLFSFTALLGWCLKQRRSASSVKYKLSFQQLFRLH